MNCATLPPVFSGPLTAAATSRTFSFSQPGLTHQAEGLEGP